MFLNQVKSFNTYLIYINNYYRDNVYFMYRATIKANQQKATQKDIIQSNIKLNVTSKNI